jgi:hypothetical protein
VNARTQRSFAFQNVVEPRLPQNAHVAYAFSAAHRVRVQQPASAWTDEIQGRLNDLTSLPTGWDGYESRPVSFTCAQFAAALLEQIYVDGVPVPSLIPGSDGAIQIEWHRNGFDLEILILGANDVISLRRNVQTGATEEEELQSDFTILRDWVSLLKSNTAQQAA